MGFRGEAMSSEELGAPSALHGVAAGTPAAGAIARLTGADALGAELLALADPVLLAAPLEEAIDAIVTMLAGFPQLDGVAIWTTDQGSEPASRAQAGAPTSVLRGGDLARAICNPGPDDTVLAIRAFGEPCAAIAWLPGRGDPLHGRVLAERSAAFLSLAFERDALLDGSVAQHAALARSAERRLSQVALDLHDGPLQDLALLRGELASLRSTLTQGEGSGGGRDPLSQLEDLEAIAEATEVDLRELAILTDANTLLRRPFDEALRGVAAAFALRSGIEPVVKLDGSGNDLSAMERGALLRVIGEALANAREHSGARHVEISVRVGDASVEASVDDDGCGFDIEQTLPDAARRGSMGLLGMVERVHHVGGTCQVDGRPGEGTTVRLAFARDTSAPGSLHQLRRPAHAPPRSRRARARADARSRRPRRGSRHRACGRCCSGETSRSAR